MLTFFPYLFDSKHAWECAIKDSSYRYDMTMTEFMHIYKKYRNGKSNETVITPKYTNSSKYDFDQLSDIPKKAKSSYSTSEILTQSEIDDLLKQFT